MDSADGLFHIDGDGALTSMAVTQFQAEAVLQELLAQHPDLLAGGRMNPVDPRRWLLVAREHGVPDREAARFDRWSLDHLFVDQDAIPTLIEVKRSTDTRIRREVVGQLLDYAANGVMFWPVDRLRESFTSTQRAMGRDPDDAVRKLTGDPDLDVQMFFDSVFENLRDGRIRLVFVADIIPDELQRIVEFLNAQMSPAEVFAVEVKQYAADGHPGRTIVPRVVGRTAQAMAKKKSMRSSLDAEMVRADASELTLSIADRISRWAEKHQLRVLEGIQSDTVLRPDDSVLARLYYASGDMHFDLVSATERHGLPQVDEQRRRLQSLTSKPLTDKWPALPAADVDSRWAEVMSLLDALL